MAQLSVVFHGPSQYIIEKLVGELTSKNLPNMIFIDYWNQDEITDLTQTRDDRILLVGVVDKTDDKTFNYDFTVDLNVTSDQVLQQCLSKFQQRIDDKQQLLEEMQETVDSN